MLSENHRRAVSVSLCIVEELLNEIEKVLNHPPDASLSKMICDISRQEKNGTLENITKAKQWIQELAHKYGLSVKKSYVSRIKSSRKSKMWEILCDTESERLRGYGEFPPEYSQEFDEDINRLQALINQL